MRKHGISMRMQGIFKRMQRIFVRMREGPDVNWDIFDVCQGGSHPFAHHSVLCQQPGFEIGSPPTDLHFRGHAIKKCPP